MGCTLVIGSDEDLCCLLVRDRLQSLGRQTLYLPENRLLPGIHFTWELKSDDSKGTIALGDQAVEFSQIDGVLARFSGIATSPEDFRTKDGQYVSAEWHALMRGFIHWLPCSVVNRPGPELWYKSSLRPADLISLVADLKFNLPRTMVATSFEEARDFLDASRGRVRYSPLTLPSNYVLTTANDARKLATLSRLLPLCLTEVVPGESVDAYVVGTRVVVEGTSDESAAFRCQHVAGALGLTFCHFNLVRTADEEWYCLSLDCVPALYACGERTRHAIVGHLVEALSPEERRGAA